MSNYLDVLEILENRYEEIDGFDFYRDLFPNNEYQGELGKGKPYRPNAIYLYQDEKDQGTERQLRRRIMLKDTWEDDYANYIEENPMTLCSGLSYRGRANTLENAQRAHAIIIDLDGVGWKEWENLEFRFDLESGWRPSPRPTYTALSGTGVHLYYVFEEPIDLYPNIKLQMKSLKHDLIFRLWDHTVTSQVKSVQYQSINQGFRMVGSVNSKYGNTVRAFKTGDRVTVDYLNNYVKEISRVDINQRFKPSKMDLETAKELYPEWYERTVVNRHIMPKKWDIAGKQGDSLYRWWLSRVGEILGGHRYFYMMCCAIYASKCDVPFSQLKEDIKPVFETLKNQPHLNPLQERDMIMALEAYDRDLYLFPIDDIEKLCDIRIEKNRRNFRKQDMHLERARLVQSIDYPNGEWRNKDGAPTKEAQVISWQKRNPKGTKAQCIRETGFSKNTVYKWWNND